MLENTLFNNSFLIAMPDMEDSRFSQTVTYICEHDEKQGAVGIIINRPMDMNVGDVFAQLNIDSNNEPLKKMPILFGGPINTDRGFVIHPSNSSWRTTLGTSQGIAITTSRDILDALAKNEGPQNVLISLGHAAWSPGQLEEEIAGNHWLSIHADPNILFNTPYPERWKAAGKLLGIDISTLTKVAGHA